MIGELIVHGSKFLALGLANLFENVRGIILLAAERLEIGSDFVNQSGGLDLSLPKFPIDLLGLPLLQFVIVIY